LLVTTLPLDATMRPFTLELKTLRPFNVIGEELIEVLFRMATPVAWLDSATRLFVSTAPLDSISKPPSVFRLKELRPIKVTGEEKLEKWLSMIAPFVALERIDKLFVITAPLDSMISPLKPFLLTVLIPFKVTGAAESVVQALPLKLQLSMITPFKPLEITLKLFVRTLPLELTINPFVPLALIVFRPFNVSGDEVLE